MDQIPRLGKRELICLLLLTCNYVVFVRRGFLFLWVLGMGGVILLWHSLSLPYNYFIRFARVCSHVEDFNARNKCLTAKLLIGIISLERVFSRSYRRHLISKINVGLKSL